MRIAICLHGKIGGLCGKDGLGGGEDIILAIGYSHFLRKIIHPNKEHEIDVFIHSWNVSHESDLTILYSPKGIITENEKIFDIPSSVKGDTNEQPTRRNSHYSRWYSYKKSVELKAQYENTHGFKYDAVLSTRFDMAWQWDLTFNKLSTKKLWMSQMYFYEVDGTKYYPHELRFLDTEKQKRVKLIKIGYPHTVGVWDAWFYTDSTTTDKIGTLFDNLPIIVSKCIKGGVISHHKILEFYFKKLEIINKLDFYNDYIGCTVVRWEYQILQGLHEHKFKA